jgi:hypothetical protein
MCQCLIIACTRHLQLWSEALASVKWRIHSRTSMLIMLGQCLRSQIGMYVEVMMRSKAIAELLSVHGHLQSRP